MNGFAYVVITDAMMPIACRECCIWSEVDAANGVDDFFGGIKIDTDIIINFGIEEIFCGGDGGVNAVEARVGEFVF